MYTNQQMKQISESIEGPEYSDYTYAIYRLAQSFNKTTGLDLADLICEGNLVFCECLETWNAEKSAFITYLVTCIKNRFRNMAKARQYQPTESASELIEEAFTDRANYQAGPFMAMLSDLSDEAKLFISELLKSKKGQIVETKKAIKEKYGWSWTRLNAVHQEIKGTLA